MITLVIGLIIVIIGVWLVFWILSQFPQPEPLNKLIRVGIVVVAVVIVIVLFLNVLGVNVGIPLR